MSMINNLNGSFKGSGYCASSLKRSDKSDNNYSISASQTTVPSFKGTAGDPGLFGKGMKAVAENYANSRAIWEAGTALGICCLLRPAAIILGPGNDMDDKVFQSAKSVSSGVLGFVFTYGIISPIKGIFSDASKIVSDYASSKDFDRSKGFADKVVEAFEQGNIKDPEKDLFDILFPPLSDADAAKLGVEKSKGSALSEAEKTKRAYGRVKEIFTLDKGIPMETVSEGILKDAEHPAKATFDMLDGMIGKILKATPEDKKAMIAQLESIVNNPVFKEVPEVHVLIENAKAELGGEMMSSKIRRMVPESFSWSLKGSLEAKKNETVLSDLKKQLNEAFIKQEGRDTGVILDDLIKAAKEGKADSVKELVERLKAKSPMLKEKYLKLIKAKTGEVYSAFKEFSAKGKGTAFEKLFAQEAVYDCERLVRRSGSSSFTEITTGLFNKLLTSPAQGFFTMAGVVAAASIIGKIMGRPPKKKAAPPDPAMVQQSQTVESLAKEFQKLEAAKGV